MSNRSKATHRGHCQACNAIQKLPAGVLAKHGYQVAGYGFFNGICMGSGHKPLEQDKSIVVASIIWAQGMIINIEKQIAELEAEKRAHFGWFHVYKPATWQRRHSGYNWEYCAVALTSGTLDTYTNEWRREGYIYTSEGTVPMSRHSLDAKNTQELVDQMNAKYIVSRRNDIKELQRYIRDQQHRIEVWHKQPLLPLGAK